MKLRSSAAPEWYFCTSTRAFSAGAHSTALNEVWMTGVEPIASYPNGGHVVDGQALVAVDGAGLGDLLVGHAHRNIRQRLVARQRHRQRRPQRIGQRRIELVIKHVHVRHITDVVHNGKLLVGEDDPLVALGTVSEVESRSRA